MTEKKRFTLSFSARHNTILSTQFRFLPMKSSLLLCAGLLTLPISSHADDNQSALRSIQQDIAAKERSVQAQKQQRDELLGKLKSQEKLIAQASRQLRETQLNLNSINSDIQELTDSIEELIRSQAHEEKVLSAQLDAAFRQGQHSGIELLLSGEDGQRSDRMLTYFRYLNTARQENIESLKQTRADLADKKSQLEVRQQQQQTLFTQQKAQQDQLQSAQSARQKTLQQLNVSLQRDQADLAEMRQNENRLQNQIARAAQEAKARAAREARAAEQVKQRQAQAQAKGSTYRPTEGEKELIARTGGLGRANGQYPWPIHGRLIHRFGDTLQGELRWKGLVIGAAEGTDVRAIADGRVLMADWLQGYGLVVVIEHGKGDMSLYGYNQSALVNVGQQVRAGQAIALVGSSGGQGAPALYFEIRRQGQAVNPLSWLGK